MSYTKTLLTETLNQITGSGKAPKDVAWVGSGDGKYAITWDEFTDIAGFHYDSGYGSAEVVPDLVIVFTDGTWLERGEYDGSEWWDYKRPPQRRPDAKPFTQVQVHRYEESIHKLNQPRDDDE